jgi:O-antigen ligase
VSLTRRLRLELVVEASIVVTIFLFACGSSSVPGLTRIGRPGRWAALLVLATLAMAGVFRNRRTGLRIPPAWIVAAGFLAVAGVSTAWSVSRHATMGRTFTLTVLFVAASALVLGGGDTAVVAVRRVLHGVLTGIAAVLLGGLFVLAFARQDAVQSATLAVGWRYRGLGQSPNTVPMLLCAGLPLALWLAVDGRGRWRWVGALLVVLFAGHIAFANSRGALVAGFCGALATTLAVRMSTRTRLAVSATLMVLALVCVAIGRIPSTRKATAGTSPVVAQKASGRSQPIDAERVFRLEDELGHPPLGTYRPPSGRTLLGSGGRAQSWVGAIHQAEQRPTLGYGFGTENKVFVDRFYTFEGAYPENSYVGLFLELGSVGLALAGALLLALGWSAFRALRGLGGGSRQLAAATGGVLVAAMLIGVTQSGLFSVGNIAATSIWLCLLALPVLAYESARP